MQLLINMKWLLCCETGCYCYGWVSVLEKIIENNPYEGYFTEEQLLQLVKYIDAGQTPDSAELGLDSKFEMECVNEFLLHDCDLVLLKVSVLEA